MEVNEEDDYCQEEPVDQIPWPVLQYQSNLATITSAPPLPDKKRKTGESSDQDSPSSSSDKTNRVNKSYYDNMVSSSDNSKESSPPTSLERLLLKSSDTEPSSDGQVEEEEKKQKVSPKAGLIRKPSILKIRAFFEKSNSEPRSEKKSKPLSSSARKANSFRLREESSKFYQSLDTDALRPTSNGEGSKTAHKLSLVQSMDLDLDGFSPTSVKDFYQLPFENSRNQTTKPSLPVKRSKSMKVYRGFDIRVESQNETTAIEPREPPPQVFVSSPSCDVFLSKTPSITYISLKDQGSAESAHEPVYSEERLSCNSIPLATSSLDRGREQRCPKTTSSVITTSTGGSLDRVVIASVQNKVIPTYVNVLIRNQVCCDNITFKNCANFCFNLSIFILLFRKLQICPSWTMTHGNCYKIAKLILCMEMKVNSFQREKKSANVLFLP